MCNRAVFLSRLEFTMLLMAEGIEEIPCFPLCQAGDVDRRKMTEAVHGLVLKGFLQVKETGLSVSPDLSEMIKVMKDSTEYVLVEPGDGYCPQRIVYMGLKAVILENADEPNYDFRLFSEERQDFWTWAEEAFDMTDPPAESKKEAMELAALNEMAMNEKEKFQKIGYPGSGPGIRFWMERLKDGMGEVPLAGLRMISGPGRETSWDLVLFPGSTNLWFLWSMDNSLEVIPDCAEARDDMRKLFGRENE